MSAVDTYEGSELSTGSSEKKCCTSRPSDDNFWVLFHISTTVKSISQTSVACVGMCMALISRIVS